MQIDALETLNPFFYIIQIFLIGVILVVLVETGIFDQLTNFENESFYTMDFIPVTCFREEFSSAMDKQRPLPP